jgi:hypothetical protein
MCPDAKYSTGDELALMWQRQGRELRSRAAETAELQDELGPTSISALQKSYSLSVSFAQVSQTMSSAACNSIVSSATSLRSTSHVLNATDTLIST